MRRYLIFALLLTGAIATAQTQNLRQKTSPPENSANVLRQARELRARHNPEKATVLLEEYLVRHADDADALTLLAQIRADAGDTKGAQDLLVRALNASPKSSFANRLAGSMLLAAQQYPEAMDRFETVLTLLPHDREARRLELDAATKLAAQARAAGNEEAALMVLEHVRGTIPDNPGLLRDLGMQASNLHRYAEAEEALAAARQLDPKVSDTLYALARVEIEQQHMPAAEKHLREYLAMRPNDASAHFGLGHVLAIQQQDAAARAEFLRSIQLQPVQTESYYQVGELDRKESNDSQAQALFQKVIARDPNHGGALAGLGELAYRAKDYAAAEAYCSRAVKAAPDYAPAHYFHGLALARLDRKAEADEEFKAAVELDKKTTVPATQVPEPPKP